MDSNRPYTANFSSLPNTLWVCTGRPTSKSRTKTLCSQRELFEGTSLLSILQQSVQQNCFFAPPENLLLAMLGDEDVNIRAKAARMIKKIRHAQEGQSEHVKVREFHLHQCNFAAHS